MRKPGKFERMSQSDEGREQIKLLVRSFLLAHNIHSIVLDISEERFLAFAKDLDNRIGEATLLAGSQKAVAAAATRAIVAALDKLFETEIPGEGEFN